MVHLVGLTRIYAGSRFIHQVLLSLGRLQPLALHPPLARRIRMGEAPRLKKFRVAEVFVIGIVWFAFVCLAVENNSLARRSAGERVRSRHDGHYGRRSSGFAAPGRRRGLRRRL